MKKIEAKLIDTYRMDSERYNYIFLTNINGYDIHWTIDKSYYHYSDETPQFDGKEIEVLWDEEKYTAEVVISGGKTASLDRYFLDDPAIDYKLNKIEVVKCPGCGNNVSIGDKKELVCNSCGHHFNLSDAQYDEVITAAEIKKNNQKLYDDIYDLFSAKTYKILPYIPYFLIVLQMFLIAFYFTFAYKNTMTSGFLKFIGKFMENNYFFYFLALPSFVVTLLILYFTRKNAYNKNIPELLSIFSPVKRSKDTVSCRNCGADLKYNQIPDFIVCPYCRSENIVLPKSTKKIDKKLDFNLIDVKILHGKYRKDITKFMKFMIPGTIILYGLYLIYAAYIGHPENIHFLVKYLAIPPLMFILSFLMIFKFAQLPANPEYDIIDLLPEKISKEFKNDSYRKIPSYVLFFYYMGLAVYIYFLVAQFFVRYNF